MGRVLDIREGASGGRHADLLFMVHLSIPLYSDTPSLNAFLRHIFSFPSSYPPVLLALLAQMYDDYSLGKIGGYTLNRWVSR